MGCHALLRGSSQPRDFSWVSCIGRQILYPLSHQGSHSMVKDAGKAVSVPSLPTAASGSSVFPILCSVPQALSLFPRLPCSLVFMWIQPMGGAEGRRREKPGFSHLSSALGDISHSGCHSVVLLASSVVLLLGPGVSIFSLSVLPAPGAEVAPVMADLWVACPLCLAFHLFCHLCSRFPVFA